MRYEANRSKQFAKRYSAQFTYSYAAGSVAISNPDILMP